MMNTITSLILSKIKTGEINIADEKIGIKSNTTSPTATVLKDAPEHEVSGTCCKHT